MNGDIITVVVALIGLAGTYLGAKYGKQYQEVKSKAGQGLDLLNAVTDVANEVYDAAKDDKVTEEEFQAVADKLPNIVALAEKLLGKQ